MGQSRVCARLASVLAVVQLAAVAAVSGCGGCGDGPRPPEIWVFTVASEPAPMVDLLGTFGENYWIWFDTQSDTIDYDGDGMIDDVRDDLLVVATNLDDLCDRLAIGPLDTIVSASLIYFETYRIYVDGGAIVAGETLGGDASSGVFLDMQLLDGAGEAAVQSFDDAMGIFTIDVLDETTLVGRITGGTISESYDGRRMVPTTPTPWTADFLAVPRCDGLL